MYATQGPAKQPAAESQSAASADRPPTDAAAGGPRAGQGASSKKYINDMLGAIAALQQHEKCVARAVADMVVGHPTSLNN